MSVLHVSIYRFAANAGSGRSMPIPQAPALDEWQIPIGTESVQSIPFPEEANFIMVKPEVPCCLAFGDDPVASVGIHPVDAGERAWYGVHPGHCLAVIEN